MFIKHFSGLFLEANFKLDGFGHPENNKNLGSQLLCLSVGKSEELVTNNLSHYVFPGFVVN